jgi:hypothetical protein
LRLAKGQAASTASLARTASIVGFNTSLTPEIGQA